MPAAIATHTAVPALAHMWASNNGIAVGPPTTMNVVPTRRKVARSAWETDPAISRGMGVAAPSEMGVAESEYAADTATAGFSARSTGATESDTGT
jgi:hypothetical protein